MFLAKVPFSHIARELIAFAATIICAIVFAWQARDIIWGLWVSSLCVGYSFIVFTIVTGVSKSRGTVPLGLALGGGIFMLVFFSFHFGMFHFVHGTFLNMFFPLVNEKQSSTSFFTLISVALKHYWPFVAASFVSRLQDFEAAIDVSGLKDGKNLFAKPYANVIRMHILIFVFAGLSIAKVSYLAIYPVLAFYFFPWGVVFRKKKLER